MSGGRAIRTHLGEERGITLTELLVVLVILGIVLAALTGLFVSAGTSQVEQTNRVEAQRNARLALDALRRELRCASAAAVTSSSITVTLPGYCQNPVAASAAPFTWCAVATVPATTPPSYSLWRYAGGTCSGVGVRKAESLVSNAIFTYNRSVPGPVQNTPVVSVAIDDGFFKPGTYSYLVSAVTSAGEIAGTVRKVTIATGTWNRITVSWNAYAGALSYKVYGRDDGTFTNAGMRLLAEGIAPATTSWPDLGCTTPAPNCTPVYVVNSASPAPPLATVGFVLVLDVTTVDGRQRFTLEDDVVLRNSGRY